MAASYLRKNGYRILKRNFRTPFGEVDIIARDGDTVVFVEVKARHEVEDISPLQNVGRLKQRTIAKVAQAFLSGLRGQYAARFDVISVNLKMKTVEHLRDAFELH